MLIDHITFITDHYYKLTKTANGYWLTKLILRLMFYFKKYQRY